AMAVVVVIADADALSPPDAREAGAFGDIVEPQATAIAIEVTGRRLSWSVTVERRGVGDEDVRQTVLVEIEYRDAVPGGFQDVLLRSAPARDVERGQAGVGGNVAKVDGDRRKVGVDRLDRFRGAP